MMTCLSTLSLTAPNNCVIRSAKNPLLKSRLDLDTNMKRAKMFSRASQGFRPAPVINGIPRHPTRRFVNSLMLHERTLSSHPMPSFPWPGSSRPDDRNQKIRSQYDLGKSGLKRNRLVRPPALHSIGLLPPLRKPADIGSGKTIQARLSSHSKWAIE